MLQWYHKLGVNGTLVSTEYTLRRRRHRNGRPLRMPHRGCVARMIGASVIETAGHQDTHTTPNDARLGSPLETDTKKQKMFGVSTIFEGKCSILIDH